MFRLRSLLVLIVVLIAATARGQDARWAVVRITSHGCSGTVIESGDNRTLLLSCAHAFRGDDVKKPLVLDVPWTADRPVSPRKAPMRIVAVDHAADLSLIEVTDGPYPFVTPPAVAGHKPGRNVWSVGYDDMTWPATMKPAAILMTDATTTYTRERPWHGRSGGALLDLDAGRVIGVVQGYEVSGLQRGLYVSHSQILTFLAARGSGPAPIPQLRIEQERGPASPLMFPSFPSPCPGGVCPAPRGRHPF